MDFKTELIELLKKHPEVQSVKIVREEIVSNKFPLGYAPTTMAMPEKIEQPKVKTPIEKASTQAEDIINAIKSRNPTIKVTEG